MSNRYKGGVISATPPTTTGGESGTASGAWTLEQQAQLQAAGLWPEPVTIKYIEDVFSTYLYAGTGNTVANTITNNINLSGKGGLVWIKARNAVGYNHALMDTARSGTLFSDTTQGNTDYPSEIGSYNSTGFTTSTSSSGYVNDSGVNFVSWTFREQPKFFDIVTYTGNGVAGRTVSHNLGSAPGFIVCKRLDTADEWFCYHRSLGASKQILLNSTGQSGTNNNQWNNTAPTSSVFSLGTDSGANGNGGSYVAYLFAHDAGGFGLNGTDNVISCGSYTGTGASGNTITLGYEPQWLLIKNAVYTGTSDLPNWIIIDNMRGMSTGASVRLYPNTSAQENTSTSNVFVPTATGFVINGSGRWENQSGATYIYVAIRRGPMKVPTDATKVFLPALGSSSGVYTVTTNFPVDSCWYGNRTSSDKWYDFDRLRGNPYLNQASTAAEVASTGVFDSNVNFRFTGFTGDGSGYINYAFQRAPGFFDEVCWTGDDTAPRNINHNLTVIPEMMIVKGRSNAGTNWVVYHKNLPSALYYLTLNDTSAQATGTNLWRSTAPTASVFTVGSDSWVNTSGDKFVNYLFATCAGVSKVGGYTGTGTTLQIDCGFTGGARFVLIKRTDSTGAWYVWDSARGIIAGNDPYLLLNSTAAEVTNTDYVDTYSAGFELSSTAPAAINANGGTFIFLAIA